MDELSQKIIELNQKKEREKIEELLENLLKHDPENTDILLRLVCLEMISPFCNFDICNLLLEKIIVINKKHEAIARTLVHLFKQFPFIPNKELPPQNKERSLDNTMGKFFFEHIFAWFYMCKEKNLIDDVAQEMMAFDAQSDYEKIRTRLEQRLNSDPNNRETLFLLGVIEFYFKNYRWSIMYFEKIISISREQEALATIFDAYIEDLTYVVDNELVSRLENINTPNNEINSMLKYASSWFYNKHDNMQKERQLLEESTALCSNYVWNYKHLADICVTEEAKELIKKALNNVVKVYKSEDVYDPTDINELFGQLIKGIYLSEPQYEWLQEELQKLSK